MRNEFNDWVTRKDEDVKALTARLNKIREKNKMPKMKINKYVPSQSAYCIAGCVMKLRILASPFSPAGHEHSPKSAPQYAPTVGQNKASSLTKIILINMRTFFLLTLLFAASSNVFSQDYKIFPFEGNIDTMVWIDGIRIREYLSRNIRYPKDAVNNSSIGTYIGCIRFDPKGNLINVFTINPLRKSIDKQFEDLINKNWRSNKMQIGALLDTTDFIIIIQFTISQGSPFSSGLNPPTLSYYVDTNLKPKYFSEPVIVIAYQNSEINNITDDQILIDNANRDYKNGKYKNCIKYINELIRRNPYNGDLIYMRAMSYVKLNKPDFACKDYRYLKYILKDEKYKSINICE